MLLDVYSINLLGSDVYDQIQILSKHKQKQWKMVSVNITQLVRISYFIYKGRGSNLKSLKNFKSKFLTIILLDKKTMENGSDFRKPPQITSTKIVDED